MSGKRWQRIAFLAVLRRKEGATGKQPSCLRRIWAHEISFFVRHPELWLICPELPLILP